MRKRGITIILFALMLAALAIPLSMAAAQEELTEFFNSEEYNLSFRYPEDWDPVEDTRNDIVVLLSERVNLAFFGPDMLSGSLARYDDAETLIIGATDNAGRNLDFEKSELEEIDGREIFYALFVDSEDREGLFATINFSDGRPGLITVQSQGRLRRADRATALAIIATVDYAQDNRNEPVSSQALRFPDQLESFDRAPNRAVRELQTLGVLPEDGEIVFDEPKFEFDGRDDNGFFLLGRNDPHTNIVMAAELEFDPRDDEYETCSLFSHIVMEDDVIVEFVEVGFNNRGEVLAYQRYGDDDDDYELFFADLDVDFDDAHFLLAVVIEDTMQVYFDGELVIEDFRIREEEGIYGTGVRLKNRRSSCTVNDYWVYQFD